MIVGRSVPRVEGREKVTGSAIYTNDMKMEGALCGKTLKSEWPHARIVHIDTRKAEKVPGVYCVLTQEDLKGDDIDPWYGPALRDQPIVAIEKVRYVGEPVAAVAAEDEETAEEALRLIEVEYEELPAVFSPREAMREGAPLIHERLWKEGLYPDLKGINVIEGTNICNRFELEWGDVEGGFKKADYVLEDTYTSPAVFLCALEPHACLARVDGLGRIEVWATNQMPFALRAALSRMFKVSMNKVDIKIPYLGGGFGSKGYYTVEPVTVALARKARRPVKVVLSLEEVFQITHTRHATEVSLKMGVKRDGTIVAARSHILWDKGAYADVGPRLSQKAGYTALGPYRIPNARVESYAVYTNKTPSGAYRGYGVPQTTLAYESHLDRIAEHLGIDPLEIRLRNVVDETSEIYNDGGVMGAGIRESLRRVTRAINWGEVEKKREKGVKAKGKGIACTIKATITPSVSKAEVKMNEDGSVVVYVGTVEMGQGSRTVLSQIAAESLGIPLEKVSIVQSQTDVVPFDQVTGSSRSTFTMGRAIIAAAEDLKKKLYGIASEMLEATELEMKEGVISTREEPKRGVSIEEIMVYRFGLRGGSLTGEGEIRTKVPKGKAISAFWSLGAVGAEVEVDRETGEVKVLKCAIAGDVGKAINPRECRGQLEGGAMMGLGITLRERVVWEGGQLINPNLIDYKVPTFEDVPEYETELVEEIPDKEGPFGAKGIGETSIPSVAPAIANAIYRAIGVRVCDLPFTQEKILKALKEKKS